VTITAADGVSTAKLKSGDEALLEEAPRTPSTGLQTWLLTDENGFTGRTEPISTTEVEQTFKLIPSQPDDALVSEVAVIEDTPPHGDPTRIVLVKPLLRKYDRPTVVIYGNVARATHGETRREVLGSGDAARAFQKLALKQKPLTYTSAPTATGAESSLKVRVNDVLWGEATSLYKLPARQRAYITRQDDDGVVTVTFGDGVNGARPPTGNENIAATYRTGIGAEGMVKAGQLSLLMTRPLGVQKVTNPLAPTGAADPETRDQARQNAPFTVLALDRIVSLRDFEDFARAFAGIGKAQATWLWDGEKRIVHVTIAAATTSGADYTVDSTSDLFGNLHEAVDAARDTAQPLVIASYEPIFFRLKAGVAVDPSYITEKVLAAVKSVLQQAYGFEQRRFGQPVHESEVLATMQGVEGVKAVFLERLHLRGSTPERESLLPARRARREQPAAGQQGKIRPAQLLLLDVKGIDLTEATL
jgi:predicted phage baseplate assembly protein